MCHVLIIEDEWLIAEYLTYLAEEAGATSIATASTEDEAVQAAHERMPDIIFSDVILLAGTGPRAVQTILSALGKIPVIFYYRHAGRLPAMRAVERHIEQADRPRACNRHV